MSVATFRCGHPKGKENTIKVGGGRGGCRACRSKYNGIKRVPKPAGGAEPTGATLKSEIATSDHYSQNRADEVLWRWSWETPGSTRRAGVRA